MLVEILLFIGLFFLWFYHYVTKQFDEFKKRGMPFAKPSFPFGSRNAKKVMTGKMTFFDLEKDLVESEEFKNEKVFGYFMMGQPTVVINDEELAKKVMIKDFDHFSLLRKFGYKDDSKENKMVHSSMTAMNTEDWKKWRGLFTKVFTSTKLKLMVPHFAKVGRQMEEYVEGVVGEDIDLRDLFSKYALDGLASGAYGLEIDSFQDPGSYFRKMAMTIAGAPGFTSPWDMPRIMLLMIAPSIAKLFKVPILPKQPALFMADIIERTIEDRAKSGERRNDLIDLVVDEMKNVGGEASEEEKEERDLILKANALVLFIAGFDTTAIGLSIICHRLVLYPEVQEKLIKEIDAELEDDDEIKAETLQNLKYLTQVIHESFRFESIMSSHERMCTKDYTIPDTNMTIPKGRIVKVYFKNMQQDEANFKNPNNFDPDNFAPENEHNKFAYMAFSQGPRNCVGMRFAMMSTQIALISILRKHRLVACEKTNMGKLELDPEGMFVIKGGIWIRAEKRT